jgi:hypothetical protein
MRFKCVPAPPATIEAVATAQQAVPLIPTTEADCFRRLVDRTDETMISDRDDARQWLPFLRALDLVDRTPSGYRRHRDELTAGESVDRLLDGVYGARELYSLLDATDRPLSVDELTDQETVDLPTWERHHHTDHDQVRRKRQQRLVDWFVLCGAVERTPEGYRMRNTER